MELISQNILGSVLSLVPEHTRNLLRQMDNDMDSSEQTNSYNQLRHGYTTQDMYFDMSHWFPNRRSTIPSMGGEVRTDKMREELEKEPEAPEEHYSDNKAEDEKLQKLMKKNVMDGIEGKHNVDKGFETRGEKKRRLAKEREESAGKKWYNLSKPKELTDEMKQDLKVLEMRHVLDNKQFFKKSTRVSMPDHFEVGTVQSHQTDYFQKDFSKRQPKKSDKLGFVDDLLADAKFRKYAKRKHSEISKEGNKPHKKRKLK